MAATSSAALDSLLPFDANKTEPVTPQPQHATIDGLDDAETRSQAAAKNMTPPPSTQSNTARAKDRTPTPTYSSISTPPPTIDLLGSQSNKLITAMAATMTGEEIASASADELRTAVTELQAAYQEAKMNAAHYKLQYQMLAQESEATLERMDVEARMAQHESDIIHIAEQAKAASTPAQSAQDGLISVQRDLYQYMCVEIQQLQKNTDVLQKENIKQDRLILQQEAEIETLSERVSLLRDRIRSNREHLNFLRKPAVPDSEYSRSAFTTPKRSTMAGQDQFAALLQASEIARKEVNPSRKSSYGKAGKVTMTPQRYQKPPAVFATPGQVKDYSVPSTAPVARNNVFRGPGDFTPAVTHHPGPRSEDTVSNSDRDVDSEAETDILEPDGPVSESQASIKASIMLRNSHEDDIDGRMAAARSNKAKQPRQTTLFGAVRKHGLDRSDSGRPTKKSRTDGVGLGITGTRH